MRLRFLRRISFVASSFLHPKLRVHYLGETGATICLLILLAKQQHANDGKPRQEAIELALSKRTRNSCTRYTLQYQYKSVFYRLNL